MYELKPIPQQALGHALEKAERYRLLQQGAVAESICDDVLARDGSHQAALSTKILAITDQFHEDGVGQNATRALKLVGELTTEYGRAYYGGIVHERRARAYMTGHRGATAGVMAYDSLTAALECFAKAIEASEPGEADAILRWNSCVRTLERHPELRAMQRVPEAVIESE